MFNQANKFNRDLDWDTASVTTFDSLVSAARRLLRRASPPPLIPSRRPAAVPRHDVEPSTSRVKFSEVSITLAGVHRLSEESQERLPALPDDVDELSTTPRKTSTMV